MVRKIGPLFVVALIVAFGLGGCGGDSVVPTENEQNNSSGVVTGDINPTGGNVDSGRRTAAAAVGHTDHLSGHDAGSVGGADGPVTEPGWTSLALDANDNPHICYYDELTSDLKYAHLAWTPTPTAVPTMNVISYDLDMPDPLLEPGDGFLLRRTCAQSYPSVITVDEYIVLDFLGNYWFWPGWTQDLDYDPSTLNPNQEYTHNILEFVWPAGAGSQDGIKFWGAFLEESSVNLLVIDSIEWAYFE